MPNWFFQVRIGRRQEIAELLLSHGARYTIFVRNALARDRSLANFEDSCHHRVLSAAVRRHDVAMTRQLLEHGADIDAIDDEYRSTPLGVAARRGQSAMIALLLERGAAPVAAAASWAVPLAWAERKGHSHSAHMLRNAGAEH